MKFVGSIRDPVYGIVPITSIEQEILKLPILNRLKNIKQLGLAYLAFPGANHTRFEHSVGVMHVASIMGTALEVNEQELETIRISGLLHDVGHPPFSHCVEFACKLFSIDAIPDHKQVTKQKILDNEEIAKILDETRPLCHLKDIGDLAVGSFRKPYLQQIIDGAIDADKIDYILRDNHHCGFPVALDINTLSEILRKHDEYGILIKKQGQSFAEQLFIGRYHLVSNIHHNVQNRLGNYLLAITLSEAWKNTDDKADVSIKMTQEWTDGNLMSYLEEKAPKQYEILRDHLLGRERFNEVNNYGFESLTPLSRYSATIASFELSQIPNFSKHFNSCFDGKTFFIETYIAKPPEPNLLIEKNPVQLLVDLPLSKAALEASLKEVHVAIYSQDKIEENDLDYSGIIEDYQKELDPSMNEKKANDLIRIYWDGNKDAFLCHKLIDLVLNSGSISLRNEKYFSSDSLLITIKSLCDAFIEVYGKTVYIDSVTELAVILNDLKGKGFLIDGEGKTLPIYEFEGDPRGDYTFPPQFLIDIEMLVTHGLLYRLTKNIKFGENFMQKYQIRVSGWGRAYYERNLSRVQELLSLYIRLKEYFIEIIKENEDGYKALFGTTEEGSRSREISQKVKSMTRKLPIKVVV